MRSLLTGKVAKNNVFFRSLWLKLPLWFKALAGPFRVGSASLCLFGLFAKGGQSLDTAAFAGPFRVGIARYLSGLRGGGGGGSFDYLEPLQLDWYLARLFFDQGLAGPCFLGGTRLHGVPAGGLTSLSHQQ